MQWEEIDAVSVSVRAVVGSVGISSSSSSSTVVIVVVVTVVAVVVVVIVVVVFEVVVGIVLWLHCAVLIVVGVAGLQ